MQKKKVFVVSVGGSLVCGFKPNAEKMKKIASSISKLSRAGFGFAIVVGGGKVARAYVNAARSLGSENRELDMLGISITRANAMLFIQALRKTHQHAESGVHQQVLTEPLQVHSVIDSGKIAVFGGIKPGITTDGVGALVAEQLGRGTAFINLTNVDGVYTADPRREKGAKLIKSLGYDELIRIVSSSAEHKPGQNFVLDLPCCQTLKRAKIRAMVLNGNKLANFESAVRGEKFRGTVIEG
ncbi:MAG: UMP kinase [Candidatus Diapherotrites archaeon]